MRLIVHLIVFMVIVSLNGSLVNAAPQHTSSAHDWEMMDEIFQKANEAYRQKDFHTAERLYKDLLTSNVVSADLYYNLGTTCAQLGKTGEAVLYLEKALKLRPHSEDVLANLNIVSPPGNVEEPFILIQPFYYIMRLLTFRQWLWACVICYGAVMILLSIRLLNERSERAVRVLLRSSLVLFIVISCFAAWSYYHTHQLRYVVVISPAASVYSGPSQTFTRLLTPSEGQKLRLLPYDDPEWRRVVLPTGQYGFIRNDVVREI